MKSAALKSPWIWLLLIGGGYEVYALVNGVPGDTLSEGVWGINHPMLPAAVGVVFGHLFWPRPCEKCKARESAGTQFPAESEMTAAAAAAAAIPTTGLPKGGV